MTKQEFKAMLETLAADWAQKKYDHAASFFAVDVKYGDPIRYQFASRADLLAFFKNQPFGTQFYSIRSYRLALRSTRMRARTATTVWC